MQSGTQTEVLELHAPCLLHAFDGERSGAESERREIPISAHGINSADTTGILAPRGYMWHEMFKVHTIVR